MIFLNCEFCECRAVLYFLNRFLTVSAMPLARITIPSNLADLKFSADLQSISMSTLARKGTAMLRGLTESAQAVTVKIQGQGAMVALSQHQYDEIITLLVQLRRAESDDGFTQALSERFDSMVAVMNQRGAGEAMDAALFTDTNSLNANYKPGTTETAQEDTL